MDVLLALKQWESAEVVERVLASLALAIFWASAGTAFVRLRWQASIDKLCILWLMTTFGFSLLNLAVLLAKFNWPANVLLTALAALGPPVAYFSYGMHSEPGSHRGGGGV